MKSYVIYSETTQDALENDIEALEKSVRNVKVEGFAFDGTNYVALVSFNAA